MSKSLCLWGAALALPILTPPSPELTLALALEDGAQLTTSLERVLTLELLGTELTMVFDGEEEQGEGPEIEMSMVERETIVFSDTYSAVDDGRAGRIERSFSEIASLSTQNIVNDTGDEFDEETPGTSELEGVAVVFVWDEDDEEYQASFSEAEEDLDEDLLAGLQAVADFSWYLPPADTEEGDTWEIDLDAFRHTASLSGNLGVLREDEDEPDDDFGVQFDDNLEGEIVGEFTGLREAEGLSLAVLQITAELSTTVYQSEELDDEEGDGESEEQYEFSFELEGELLWNVAAGHAHAFRFGGDCSLILTAQQSYRGGGHEITITTVRDFEGRIDYEITVE
jgi:hypothetical protein